MDDFTFRTHTEKRIDGFTALDGTIQFFGFVQAVLAKTGAARVLDFGAGRGAALHDDNSNYRRSVRNLQVEGVYVIACDVDDVVMSHPGSDEQIVVKLNVPLPFADNTFDVVVSDMTFEHIANAKFVASELKRILRPGGYICARTPNRYGYVRLVTGLIPNNLHSKILKYIQPKRKIMDVFPTYYRMNSPSSIKRLFSGCNVYHYYHNAEPAYYFDNQFLYYLFLILHKILPDLASTTLCVFIEKPR